MDWATMVATVGAAVSAVVAAVGLVFAGRQLRMANRQHAIDQRVAYDGVAVSWQALEAPAPPGAGGLAQWLYVIAVHNPGKLPIQNVTIRLTLPCEVTRIRYDGSVGQPTHTLTMRHPVLAGGEHRKWRRRLRIQFDARRSLRNTFAHVEFRDVDGKQHSNRWPRHSDDRLPTSDEYDENAEPPMFGVSPVVSNLAEPVVAGPSCVLPSEVDHGADDSGRVTGRYGSDVKSYTGQTTTTLNRCVPTDFATCWIEVNTVPAPACVSSRFRKRSR